MIPHKQKLHSKDIKQAKKKKKNGNSKGGFSANLDSRVFVSFFKKTIPIEQQHLFFGPFRRNPIKKATFAKTSKYGVHMSCSIPFNSISSQTEMCRKLGCVFQNMKENLILGHCPHPVLLKPVYLGHAY